MKGWQIIEVYEDNGISGVKGRDKRPAFDKALKDVVRGKFDVLMSWDVSRLGRSLSDLVQALADLHANRVDLYLHQQAIDTTTPSGKALFQMCGVRGIREIDDLGEGKGGTGQSSDGWEKTRTTPDRPPKRTA